MSVQDIECQVLQRWIGSAYCTGRKESEKVDSEENVQDCRDSQIHFRFLFRIHRHISNLEILLVVPLMGEVAKLIVDEIDRLDKEGAEWKQVI